MRLYHRKMQINLEISNFKLNQGQIHNNYIVFPYLFPHYKCQNAYGARSRDLWFHVAGNSGLIVVYSQDSRWSNKVESVFASRRTVAICDADDVGPPWRRSDKAFRLSDTGAMEVNRIFVGKTSRYEYLCMLYDLARALEKSGESATSRGHRICAVECKYVLKYIKKDRAREWERKNDRERKRESEKEKKKDI